MGKNGAKSIKNHEGGCFKTGCSKQANCKRSNLTQIDIVWLLSVRIRNQTIIIVFL